MARAAKVCAQPGCAAFVPCDEHTSKPWAASSRRTRTLSGSAQQKRAARIMRQYDRTCHVCGQPMADEVDHVVPLAEGGADDDSNLRPIHSRPCHQAKTEAEARRAKEGMGGMAAALTVLVQARGVEEVNRQLVEAESRRTAN